MSITVVQSIRGATLTVVNVELTLTTAGGKIVCRRCNAMSKRSRVQCGAPAMHGKTKCKTHGGLSTGPLTDEGKLRCAQAKTIHGKDTRADMKWTPKTGQQFKWDTVTRNGVNHDRYKKAQRSPAGVQGQGGA